MDGSAFDRDSIAPSRRTASAVAGFFVDEFRRDGRRLALPRPQIQIVVRFGPSARNGLDVHALGVQQTVRRKFIRDGQRAVAACLQLGASKAVLGVPASAVAGCVLALDELWGASAVQRLLDCMQGARSASEATAILEGAIADRLTRANPRDAEPRLALEAAARLASAKVSSVATELGVSERHLRRVFRDAIGIGPKQFARLTRFRRALRAAREDSKLNWASIAAATGYYDQAHLIDEFHTIAGVAPRALLSELGPALTTSSSRGRGGADV